MFKTLSTVTIIGGSGFVGTQLAQEFCKNNFIVKLICRDSITADHKLRILGFPGQITALPLDITKEDVLPHLSDSDIIINLLGISREQGSNTFETIHITIPSKLAEYCYKTSKKFIHFSAFFDPSAAQTSLYAKTKLKGQKQILSNNPDAIIICPSVIYGQNGGIVEMFENLANYSPIIPLCNSNNTISPVYLPDLAKVIFKLTQTNKFNGQILPLTQNEDITLLSFVKLILNKMKKSRLVISIPTFLMLAMVRVLCLNPRYKIGSEFAKMSCYSIPKNTATDLFIEFNIPKSNLDKNITHILDTYQVIPQD